MYDNQPYKRDYELCNTNNVRLVSGNVIKYYTFQYNWDTPYLISTQDDKTEEMLAAMRVEAEAAAARVYQSEDSQLEEEISEDFENESLN